MTIRAGTNIGVRTLLLIIAIVLFIVAALGFDVGRISLVAAGLAFFAAAFIVGDRRL